MNLKENSLTCTSSVEKVNLVTRSINLWEQYMKGKLSKEVYRALQEETLREIRERGGSSEQKASKEKS